MMPGSLSLPRQAFSHSFSCDLSPVCEELLVGPGNEEEEDMLASAQEKPLSSRRALRVFPAGRPLPGVWSQGLEASDSSLIHQLLSLWQSRPPVVCVHTITFLQIEPQRPGHRRADGAGLLSPWSGVTLGMGIGPGEKAGAQAVSQFVALPRASL